MDRLRLGGVPSHPQEHLGRCHANRLVHDEALVFHAEDRRAIVRRGGIVRHEQGHLRVDRDEKHRRRLWESLAIVVLIDASATIGLTNRQGLGRARHIEVNELWAQQKLEDNVFVLKKVMVEHNHADILTKPKDHIALVNHMKAIGFVRKHAVNHLLGN